MSDAMNLWQRLANAQSKVDYVQKEKKQGMNYSIVSHDAVTAKVRPVLVECGIHYHPVALQFNQNGNRTEVALTVRFVNVDKPEEFIDVPSLGYVIDTQDKGPGKAISYAVKYALLKTLGLETGDDPELDQDVKHELAPRSTAAIDKPVTKDETRALKDELCKDINAHTSALKLRDWAKVPENRSRKASLHPDFQDVVSNSWLERLGELEKELAV
jgi:hypothetical protein